MTSFLGTHLRFSTDEGNPEIIGSSVELVLGNALVLIEFGANLPVGCQRRNNCPEAHFFSNSAVQFVMTFRGREPVSGAMLPMNRWPLASTSKTMCTSPAVNGDRNSG